MLHFLNPELQLKYAESVIKKNMLTELREFEFVTTLILVFGEITKESMTLFVQTEKEKLLSMKVTLMVYLNQSILQLYQTYQHLYENVQAGLSIQSLSIILVYQNIFQKHFL